MYLSIRNNQNVSLMKIPFKRRLILDMKSIIPSKNFSDNNIISLIIVEQYQFLTNEK